MPIVLLYAWLGLGGTLMKFVVPANDAALIALRDGVMYHARPFTGVVYETGSSGLPAHLTFFWRGRDPNRSSALVRKSASR